MKYIILAHILFFAPMGIAAELPKAKITAEDTKIYKLLLEPIPGKQVVHEVTAKSGINNPSIVLWDERVDGPLPAIELGAMERSGNTLLVNNVKKAAYERALAEEEAAKLAKQNAIDAKKTRMSVLLDKMSEGKATPEETQEFLTIVYK
jgi:hypothetical protein